MNIFVLDKDPTVAATMHCDKHVVKMILESAQMICTTHHLCPNTNESYVIPYKMTHKNHPCNKWVRDSIDNYQWLVQLTTALNNEYRYRYNKNVNHKSYDAIATLPLPNLPKSGLTVWARAMADEYKIGDRTYDNVIQSYHNYYSKGKTHILSYTNRVRPTFLNRNTAKV
jgi:hypothetical protein